MKKDSERYRRRDQWISLDLIDQFFKGVKPIGTWIIKAVIDYYIKRLFDIAVCKERFVEVRSRAIDREMIARRSRLLVVLRGNHIGISSHRNMAFV
ncbi:MAG: hypothetical protein A3C40_23510 [Burkholderiales bacterium RIFCSPHIGHO2_02_FULL_64_19]|nr:MAG: hypothetical protein A3C40_23510 [Burkholderiales bacterium RIFCSPHIGHO2_02_FULL_64_19]